MNSASTTILEVAIAQYESMDLLPGEINVEGFMVEMAKELVSELWGADDDEMWPSWCNLVVTRAIERTIDWESIQEAVNDMLVDRYIDDLFL